MRTIKRPTKCLGRTRASAVNFQRRCVLREIIFCSALLAAVARKFVKVREDTCFVKNSGSGEKNCIFRVFVCIRVVWDLLP